MKLTEKQIRLVKTDLCSYDKRNPDHDPENEKSEGVCYCDNCFYSRTELAEMILKLLEDSQDEMESTNAV